MGPDEHDGDWRQALAEEAEHDANVDWKRRALAAERDHEVRTQEEWLRRQSRLHDEVGEARAELAAAVADRNSESANRVACEEENDRLEAEVVRLRVALEQIQRCGARNNCQVCKRVVDAALAAKGGG